MFATLLRKIIGSKNERELKKLWPIVEEVSGLESDFAKLTDAELREKTPELKGRLAQGATLDDILPEAFAAVREASKRALGLRHFDVQILGGIVLHQGRIAEMKTGEGKTLVATLPVYLNALEGKGVHIVTVNDYLARRDVQWMGPIYHFLGLSVASIVHEMSYLFDPTHVIKDYRLLNLRPVSRRDAYLADITYGTNNEFGFDYLRDNMKFSLEEYTQRELHYAIVDEVDNILIDEARTPLIISGPAEESTQKYYVLDRVIPRLKKEVDYTVDEKLRTAILTEEGVAKVERLLGVENLYDPGQIDTLHHANQALKAHTLFKRDVDYVLKDGEVIIVDEFTGRLMPGRRWSDGLHQAIEAKEGVRIERENQTLATITIQNYFRMYKKLAGMTGTADTEAVEFRKIYSLDVVVIPTHRPMVRTDNPDMVYKTEREKYQAVVEEIADCHSRGQPVLVGTTSVEKSERLSKMLKREGIKHNVLNAVNHEAEANIIAQAGRLGAVTIATNMAGRGVDILLGGNPEFLARADMENEWFSRAAASPFQGRKRYEEALRELREQYDDTVQRARQRYEKEWEPLEEARAEALQKLTTTYRHFLEATYRKTKADYQEAAANFRVVEGATERKLRKDYDRARAEYEKALAEYEKAVGPIVEEEERKKFEECRREYDLLLEESAHGQNPAEDTAEKLTIARARYEKMLGDFEKAVLKAAESSPMEDGDVTARYDAARRAHEEAEQAYQEADRQFTEKRAPYEKAVAEAQKYYEETRRKYVQTVEELREQIEKAPDEYRQRYEEVLQKYRDTCAREREKVVAAGGLHILGTERHEARRIDNQLRGRSGRQGDPGSSRFYLSLEDDLLRIFGADRIQGIMNRLGMEEGVPIEHRLVTRAIANAQKKVEAHNFDIRKHLLEYDDVMNKQREVIYHQRREVLAGENLKEEVLSMAEELAESVAGGFADKENPPEEWDWKGIQDSLFRQFTFRLNLREEEKADITPEGLQEVVVAQVRRLYEEKEKLFTPPILRHLEKVVMLQTIDFLWKDHLLAMDHLKEGIGLRGYGQRNPLQEYQREGFDIFEEMVRKIQEDVVEKLFTVQIARQDDVERLEARRRPAQMVMSHGANPQGAVKTETVRREGAKVGRNNPCPCGSGKKYKKCCGK